MSVMMEEATPAALDEVTGRIIHPKRSHRKSRMGCTSCKTRKVKCDEGRPTCRSCRIRRTTCTYESAPRRRKAPTPASDASSVDDSDTPTAAASAATSQALVAASSPLAGASLGMPRMAFEPIDALDMKLLWFYTSNTHQSLSYADKQQRDMNTMLQTVVVQQAFDAPYLMNSLLELAGLHLQSMGQSLDPQRALMYRAKSYEGFRQAISDPKPENYGPMLANSVMRPVLAAQPFQDASCPNLYFLDWLMLWRGVPSIIGLTGWTSVRNLGLRPMFARPPVIEPESAQMAIPKQLLLMISFIGPNEDDAVDIAAYQEGLRVLGALFDELPAGMDSVMAFRIITWTTFIPYRIVDLAREGRPRALVILAHYAAFWKLIQDLWWARGIGDRSLRDICHAVGEEWQQYLSIPLAALLTEDPKELTRAILEIDESTS